MSLSASKSVTESSTSTARSGGCRGGSGGRTIASPDGVDEFPYYWRVKTRLPERFGDACKVLVRGKRNSALVEFTDGHQVVTSRNYTRRRHA